MGDEIIKVLDALCEKFGIVTDWSSKNIMPYLQELCGKIIKYEIATSVVWLVVGIAIILLGVWVSKKAKHILDEFDDELGIFLYIVMGVLFVIGMAVVMVQTFDIVTCITFPEKILLEEINDLYNGMKG